MLSFFRASLIRSEPFSIGWLLEIKKTPLQTLLVLPKRNAYGNWPASGEIDLVESRGNTGPGAGTVLGGGLAVCLLTDCVTTSHASAFQVSSQPPATAESASRCKPLS